MNQPSLARKPSMINGAWRPPRRPIDQKLTTRSAIATIEVAGELGLRVPEDLSIVGFDNIPESVLCTPPLTTVEQPIRTMGQRAIEMLVQLIRGEIPQETHITLATRLVVRQSTRAI